MAILVNWCGLFFGSNFAMCIVSKSTGIKVLLVFELLQGTTFDLAVDACLRLGAGVGLAFGKLDGCVVVRQIRGAGVGGFVDSVKIGD